MNTKSGTDENRGGVSLVLGGTGKTGRRVAERLRARGVATRIASRSADPAFDWNEPDTWPAALEGVTAAYISYAPDLAVPGAADSIRAFVDQAVARGVGRLVPLSGRGEEEAQACERIIQEADVEWTVVRASCGRVHDLGIFGHADSGQRVFIGVEAKVDESFGLPVKGVYLAAEARQIGGISTNAPARIEQLLAGLFKVPEPAMFDIRYQLLYATAGTLAVEADLHVLYVIVFKTPLYNETLGAENYRDYVHFMEEAGAEGLCLASKEAVGHVFEVQGRPLVCLHEYFQL